MTRTASLVLLSTVLLAACTTASVTSEPATSMNGVLVGPNRMTLYVFDKDSAGSGKSMCNGLCSKNWPPLIVSTSDAPLGPWSVIVRDDGGKQWAYMGRPLYYWAKDARPGDMTGDGLLNNAWHSARP
ncbi:COG4315 family predicted lipoprotein [Burkholderia cepacia]|uniref:COG4315 family predicted lipoprotein n=1 Tax=Burkholderia cepacia TaxID=292 RepID=UPI00158B1CE6|nr:hypothetical protein [Burkholderia cepacia]